MRKLSTACLSLHRQPWPRGYDRDLDGFTYEPAVATPPPTLALPAAQSFAVLSASGRVLGRFGEINPALAAMACWGQAVAVIDGRSVIARKSARVAAMLAERRVAA